MIRNPATVNGCDDMPREIEIKFALPRPDLVRSRLLQLGASLVTRRREINRLLDTHHRDLLARGCGLRIREIRSMDNIPAGAFLTFKGPISPHLQPDHTSLPPDSLRDREEIETAVSSAQHISRILHSLGFREVIRYEKVREIWQFADVEVALDELPRLGHFVEIEGPSAPAVASAREILLLNAADALSETYVALCARHGLDLAGVRVLEFQRS